MESKPAQNIQDSFLNTARKDKSVITIYLLSGVKLTGRIRSFDKYSVVNTSVIAKSDDCKLRSGLVLFWKTRLLQTEFVPWRG